jgi:hypothetical protein
MNEKSVADGSNKIAEENGMARDVLPLLGQVADPGQALYI